MPRSRFETPEVGTRTHLVYRLDIPGLPAPHDWYVPHRRTSAVGSRRHLDSTSSECDWTPRRFTCEPHARNMIGSCEKRPHVQACNNQDPPRMCAWEMTAVAGNAKRWRIARSLSGSRQVLDAVHSHGRSVHPCGTVPAAFCCEPHLFYGLAMEVLNSVLRAC